MENCWGQLIYKIKVIYYTSLTSVLFFARVSNYRLSWILSSYKMQNGKEATAHFSKVCTNLTSHLDKRLRSLLVFTNCGWNFRMQKPLLIMVCNITCNRITDFDWLPRNTDVYSYSKMLPKTILKMEQTSVEWMWLSESVLPILVNEKQFGIEMDLVCFIKPIHMNSIIPKRNYVWTQLATLFVWV